jgi:hypothetical protein
LAISLSALAPVPDLQAEASDVTHGVFGLDHGGTATLRDYHEPFPVFFGSLVLHLGHLRISYFWCNQERRKFWALCEP